MSETAVPAGAVAIVGMAGRFPAARTTRELWRLLADGREATTWLGDDELIAAGANPDDLRLANYVKAAMVLPDMEMFDAGFFGFSPREAAILDPQHRHFLECCWEALEDAGHVPRTFEGAIGVFGGCGMQAYMAEHLLPNRKLRESVGLFLLRHTGNDKDFLTTRVSYLLDLKGPSIGVQTACSTSLVAVHMACQSLLAGECDMALAGGVSIELPHAQGYIAAEGEILSPTGHCAAFDDDAKGTIFGSGAAVLVLRRLEDALADGDAIRAVILGTAVNNDGAGKAGYLAPSVDGQARAAAEAVAIAGVPAASIDYIEAHGTGTVIGDPIELTALSQVYGAGATAGSIGIGSVKTNIGHLDTAAGAASLIKVVLGMEHGSIPASLNFKRPNSRFDFAMSPFAVAATARAWTRTARPRRAAVNSLGVGGTNAHIVIEEPPVTAPASRTADTADDFVLVTLSAKTPAALDGLVGKWQDFLANDHRPFSLADAAYTTQIGREAFPHRLAVATRSKACLVDALAGRGPRRAARGTAQGIAPTVVFMFPGGGAQYPGAARGLYHAIPAFRSAADRCLALLPPDATSLGGLLFGKEADAPGAGEKLEHPLLSILAVFTVSYALARTWESLGVAPAAVLGHSAGDYAAAVVAGVMSLEDAIGLVAMRGEIFAALPPGAMLSVQIDEAELRRHAGSDLDVAVLNGPGLGVVSGTIACIEALKVRLDAAGIDNSRVRIGVAAHSRMLDPFLERFRTRLASILLSPPRLPMISSLTGDWADPSAIATPEHWVRHLRETVRFGDGLATVLAKPGRVLLEVGSGQGLSALARLAEGKEKPRAIISSTRSVIEADDDLAVLAVAAGALWANGTTVDLAQLRGPGPHRRMPLPTYAFERQRHWIDAPAWNAADQRAVTPTSVRSRDETAVQRLARRADWFLEPAMQPISLDLGASPAKPGTWLVLTDGSPLASALAAELTARKCTAIVVTAGSALAVDGEGPLSIDPANGDHYRGLVAALDARKARIDGVVHLWSLSGDGSDRARTFDGLLHLLQATTHAGWDDLQRLVVVTHGVAAIDEERPSSPLNATLLGPVRVWPRETPGATATLVDIAREAAQAETLASRLADEALHPGRDTLVALRDGRRLVETVVPTGTPDATATRVKRGGVYLVTGGLGGIGRLLARHLVEVHGARVALVGRRPEAQLDAETRAEVAGLGESALVLAGDVTDEASMARVIEDARRHFGRLDGVFHAAGTMDDAPLATKTLEGARAVMAPKVEGGRILDRLLPLGAIELFAVFSSTSALAGPPGQIDYTAANAYLDALAVSRPDGLAIAWGIWRDAGLATRVRTGAGTATAEAAAPEIHPLLGRRVDLANGAAVFEARYNAARLWALSEHIVGTTPVLPGTAYIEIARAALAAVAPGRKLALADGELLAPLAVPFATRPTVVTELASLADGTGTITVSSSLDAHAERTLHFRARVVDADGTGVLLPPWDAGTEVPADGLVAQAGAVDFGPRWQSIRSVAIAGDRARATLQLGTEFAGDLETAPAHPALTDMAVTIGLHLLPLEERTRSLYVPARIGRLTLHGAMPQRLLADAHLVSAAPSRNAVFDVVVADETGAPVMTLDAFEMRAIPREGFALPAELAEAGGIVGRLLAAGIRASEAPELLAAALAAPGPRLVVSSISLGALDGLYRARLKPVRREERDREPVAAEEAMTATEQIVAGLFADLLGLDRVGTDDEFLALGGHSLAAVRLFASIRRQLGVDLGIATLFEAPSVKELAALIDESRGETPVPAAPAASAAAAPAVPVPAAPPAKEAPRPPRLRGSGRWRPLVRIAKGEPGRPPLYWIHGAMGNVVSIKPLSDQIGKRYPVYGLQAQGIDGRLPPLEKVEDMAMSYVAAIQEVDPEGPYCLLGYSGGGVIGYEMARQIEAAGQKVALLAMIDSLAPTHAHGASIADWLRFAYREGIDRLAEQLKLGLQQTVEQWSRRLQPQAGSKESVDQLVVNSERVFDAYVRAQSHYYTRPYAGEVVLFRAVRGGIPFQMAGPTLGWDQHVGERIEVHDIDGNHATIIEPPSVNDIASTIEARLERLWREQTGLSAPGEAEPIAPPHLIAAK
ncbi:MAG: SDR family NAD(P)-dependent oxidoreductase [Hyphomicrobiaceae bacterium]|nr:SDR family NAD(P)-dependent oxidoreductase [Hyphomicrobiaceae bacterium]